MIHAVYERTPVGLCAIHKRLLRGGTERGRLFSLSTDDHFHLDAPNGDPALAGQAMRFRTNDLLRVRINHTVTGQS